MKPPGSARRLRGLGVDLIDVSWGTSVNAEIPTGPGYQTRFAERVRRIGNCHRA